MKEKYIKLPLIPLPQSYWCRESLATREVVSRRNSHATQPTRSPLFLLFFWNWPTLAYLCFTCQTGPICFCINMRFHLVLLTLPPSSLLSLILHKDANSTHARRHLHSFPKHRSYALFGPLCYLLRPAAPHPFSNQISPFPILLQLHTTAPHFSTFLLLLPLVPANHAFPPSPSLFYLSHSLHASPHPAIPSPTLALFFNLHCACELKPHVSRKLKSCASKRGEKRRKRTAEGRTCRAPLAHVARNREQIDRNGKHTQAAAGDRATAARFTTRQGRDGRTAHGPARRHRRIWEVHWAQLVAATISFFGRGGYKFPF